MRPPLTFLFLPLSIPLGMLSEKGAMALFLGSTAFLNEPVDDDDDDDNDDDDNDELFLWYG